MKNHLNGLTEGGRQSLMHMLSAADDINDEELRKKVVRAWTMALEESSFADLKEVGESMLHGYSLIEHIKGVTDIVINIAESLKKNFSELRIDRDVLLSGALCHDIGMLYENDPINKQEWSSNVGKMGNPAIRHPVYGVHIAMKAELPSEVVHIIGAHSPEGENVMRSMECCIVHHADYLWWEILARKNWNKPAYHEVNRFESASRYYRIEREQGNEE